MQLRPLTTSILITFSISAFSIVAPARGADMAAGKDIATSVCAACHGANGVSVRSTIPNLAAQRAPYLEKQLKAYSSGNRKHQIMGALANQLSASQMADVAAFYAGLAGPAAGAPNSKPPANYIARRVGLPSDLSDFTHYMTFNHKGRKQLRKVYANRVAVEATKAGRPLPDGSVIVVEAFKARLDPEGKPVTGADGFYVADGRAGYTAMERQPGWGSDFPEMIRNGNWHYGVFKPDRSSRPNVNQATCLACHKPLAADSYIFSLKELKAAASR